MKDSTNNITYLPHAAKNEGATPPAADIHPLTDDESDLVEKYLRLTPQNRRRVQSLLMRMMQRGGKES